MFFSSVSHGSIISKNVFFSLCPFYYFSFNLFLILFIHHPTLFSSRFSFESHLVCEHNNIFIKSLSVRCAECNRNELISLGELDVKIGKRKKSQPFGNNDKSSLFFMGKIKYHSSVLLSFSLRVK